MRRKKRARSSKDRKRFWRQWVKFRGLLCFYCRREMHFGEQSDPDRATIDHLIPLSKGGGNSNSNLVGCCRSCNSEKGDIRLW